MPNVVLVSSLRLLSPHENIVGLIKRYSNCSKPGPLNRPLHKT